MAGGDINELSRGFLGLAATRSIDIEGPRECRFTGRASPLVCLPEALPVDIDRV